MTRLRAAYVADEMSVDGVIFCNYFSTSRNGSCPGRNESFGVLGMG